MALDINSKTFMIYMAIQEWEKILIYFKKQVQIKAQSRAQIGALLFNKVFTKILIKYSDYNNIFLVENTAELSENTKMNKYAIKLKEDKQLLFGPIYSLKPVELETLKTYI